jgi:putative endonuclease
MFSFFKTNPPKPKSLGQLGEEFAQVEYKKQGYKIIAQNEFNKKGKRLGEIDFIAINKQKIVFAEVKTRTEKVGKYGTALESVNVFKQRKLLLAVKMYLLRNPRYQVLIPQIDVIVVDFDKLDNSFKIGIIIPSAIEDFN